MLAARGPQQQSKQKERESGQFFPIKLAYTPEIVQQFSRISEKKSAVGTQPCLCKHQHLVNPECKGFEVSRNMKPGCVASWCVLVSFHPQKAELHGSALLLGRCSQVPPVLPGLYNTTVCRGSAGISLSSLHRQWFPNCSSWRTHNSLSLFQTALGMRNQTKIGHPQTALP